MFYPSSGPPALEHLSDDLVGRGLCGAIRLVATIFSCGFKKIKPIFYFKACPSKRKRLAFFPDDKDQTLFNFEPNR